MSLVDGVLRYNARSKRWLGLSILMLPVLLVTVDNTVLGFALPKIAEALHPSANQQLWMIDAYSLVLACLLVSMGGVGDRVGHRKLLLIGSLGFGILSTLTAYSETAIQLIAGRAAMGVFGAMLMPSTLALIRYIFNDRQERRLAVAVWATMLTVGSALGPLVGGVLLEYFSWRSVFLLAIPVLVPLLIFGPILLPESDRNLSISIDLWSVLQSILALGAFVYGIKHLFSEGINYIAILALIISGVAGWVFVHRQLRLSVPLMDLGLFRRGDFTSCIVVNLLSLAFLIGFVFFATQFLQIVLRLSPLSASLMLVPGQIMAVLAGIAVIRIVPVVPMRWIICVLLIFIALAFLLVACFGSNSAVLVMAFAFLNIGVGAIATVSNDIVLSAAPPSKAGGASAISETAYEVGVVLGTTIIGGLVTAYYKGVLKLPEYLVGEQAILAKETLSGAFVASRSLPIGNGNELMAVAGGVFEDGVMMVSWLAFSLAAIVICICWRTLAVGAD